MTDLSTTFFIFTQFLSLLDGLDELFQLGLVKGILLITEVAAQLSLSLLVDHLLQLVHAQADEGTADPLPAALAAVLDGGSLQDFHFELA